MSGCHTSNRTACIGRSAVIAGMLLTAGCASGPPSLPYPAFIQTDELPDVYLAGLPDVDAKQLAGDPRTRRTSNRIVLPANWKFSTGASPGKSVELFVLRGQIQLADIPLGAGGYAYLPTGSLGMSMTTAAGAELLYFLDDPVPGAVIETPLILSSELVSWQPVSDDPRDFGLAMRELRADPGSGARTWLLKIDPVAARVWQKTSVAVEGFLVQGVYQHSECVNGEVVTGGYTAGGYFQRPPNVLNGGPDARSDGTAIWFLRTLSGGEVVTADRCLLAVE